MFPCAISTDLQYILHRLHPAPTHVNLFTQPICTLCKFSVPPHLFLQFSLSPAPLIPALAGRWLICAPGNLVLSLIEKQTKPQLLQQNPTKHPLLHLQVVATCGTAGVGRYSALFFSFLITRVMNMHGEELWTSYIMMDSVCCEQPCLTHWGPWAKHLSLEAVKVEEVSGLALPSL